MSTVFIVVHQHPGWEERDLDHHEIIGVFHSQEKANEAELEADKNCFRGGGYSLVYIMNTDEVQKYTCYYTIQERNKMHRKELDSKKLVEDRNEYGNR